MTEQEFISFLQVSNIPFDDGVLKKLNTYRELLQEYNKKFNLTAITKTEEIYLKHFYDSIIVSDFVNFNLYQEIVDVGTGAGFPGVVLGIFFPKLKVFLIESNGKKCEFLKVLKETLALNNISIINDRAETFALKSLDKFAIVISRAVADLAVLAELCLPLLKPDGLFIAMKGKEDELAKSKRIITKLKGKLAKIENYQLPLLNHDRSLIIIKKDGITPKGYPRNYQEIIKKH